MQELSTIELIVGAVRATGLDDESIRDAGEHGADVGFGDFIYTSDCVAFFETNSTLIWKLVTDTADEQGMNPGELIGSFVRKDMLEDWDTFRNLLAWFALEEAGRHLTSPRYKS